MSYSELKKQYEKLLKANETLVEDKRTLKKLVTKLEGQRDYYTQKYEEKMEDIAILENDIVVRDNIIAKYQQWFGDRTEILNNLKHPDEDLQSKT